MSTVFFNLRIDEQLNEDLIKIAEAEGRSKNKQIEQILKEYVKEYKRDKSDININQQYNEKAIIKIDRK